MSENHMYYNAQKIYIPFLDDDSDLDFLETEVTRVKKLWDKGLCIYCLADDLKRDSDIVFVLLIDLARNEYIPERENGYNGKCGAACHKRAKRAAIEADKKHGKRQLRNAKDRERRERKGELNAGAATNDTR